MPAWRSTIPSCEATRPTASSPSPADQHGAHAQAVQAVDHRGGVGTQLVLEGQQAGRALPDGDGHHGGAPGAQLLRAVLHAARARDPLVGQELSAPHQDRQPFDARPHTEAGQRLEVLRDGGA
jgi:hypothetical protein